MTHWSDGGRANIKKGEENSRLLSSDISCWSHGLFYVKGLSLLNWSGTKEGNWDKAESDVQELSIFHDEAR